MGKRIKPKLKIEDQPRYGALRPASLFLALGIAAGILSGLSESDTNTAYKSRSADKATLPQADVPVPIVARSRLERPCELPYRKIGLQAHESKDADIESENPLLACLGSLGSACWDMGSPSGQELCLDYGSASVSEINGKSHVAISISADGNEFYDYALFVSRDRCQRAVAKLNGYARQALENLPAAGDLSQKNQIRAVGWTTDCLTQARSAEILGSSGAQG